MIQYSRKYKCSEEVIEATEKEIKTNIMKDKFIREKIAELETQYHAQFSEATMTFRVRVYFFIYK